MGGRPPTNQTVDYNVARARKMKADASLAELEVKKANREYIAKNEVIKGWTEVLGVVKSKITALPSIVSPMLAVETEVGKIRDILSVHINETLEELSNYDPSNNKTSNADSKATAKIDSKSVGRPRKATIIGS